MVVTFLLFYAHCSNKRKEREAFEKTLVIFVAIIRERHGLRHAFLFCLYLFVFLVCFACAIYFFGWLGSGEVMREMVFSRVALRVHFWFLVLILTFMVTPSWAPL